MQSLIIPALPTRKLTTSHLNQIIAEWRESKSERDRLRAANAQVSLRAGEMSKFNLPCPPVHRLPNEIITKIFEFLKQDSFPNSSWVRVACVCQYWRAVALGNPLLWTTIRDDNISIAELCLRRSRGFPLDVSLHSSDRERPTWEYVMHLLPHRARIARLDVEATCKGYMALSPLRLPDLLSRSLRHLKIVVEPSRCHPAHNHELPLDLCPEVQTLHLSNVRIRLANKISETLRLTSLNVTDAHSAMPVQTIMSILHASPTLEDLTLAYPSWGKYNILSRVDSSIPPVELRRLRYMSLCLGDKQTKCFLPLVVVPLGATIHMTLLTCNTLDITENMFSAMLPADVSTSIPNIVNIKRLKLDIDRSGFDVDLAGFPADTQDRGIVFHHKSSQEDPPRWTQFILALLPREIMRGACHLARSTTLGKNVVELEVNCYLDRDGICSIDWREVFDAFPSLRTLRVHFASESQIDNLILCLRSVALSLENTDDLESFGLCGPNLEHLEIVGTTFDEDLVEFLVACFDFRASFGYSLKSLTIYNSSVEQKKEFAWMLEPLVETLNWVCTTPSRQGRYPAFERYATSSLDRCLLVDYNTWLLDPE